MTRCLVTGGAGFIGSHLCRHLLDRGDEVVVVDDLSTGRRANLPLDKRLHFVQADLSACAELPAIVAGVECVFHLAAAVGVALLASHPTEIVSRNVIASERLLAACARHGRPLLLTSSSEVYGRGGTRPLREDTPLELGPSHSGRWAYACSKLMVEHAAYAYAQSAGLRFVAVRLFNTVGPRQRGSYGMVIPRLVEQALAGEPLSVYGDGTQTRCFCHVADIVTALPRLLGASAAMQQVVNLGSDRPVSVNALAARVAALAGTSVHTQHVPFESVYGAGFEDVSARLPDLSKARRLIDFAPTRELDQILVDVIASLRADRAGA